MAFLGKARTATGAGVIATLILVLAFGNQAFTEWVTRHTNGNSVWGWFLRVLSWPAWAFSPSGDSASATRDLLAQDLRALLLVVFVAGILGISSKSLTGGGGAFILGWAALVFGSAVAAFMTTFITSHATLLGAFQTAAVASAYGLFAGWLVGTATAGGKAGG